MDFTDKRLSKSNMGHNKLDSCQKDKKIQFEGNNTHRSSPRMKCSYVYSSFFKVQGVLSFPLRFHALFFTGVISLYSPILFNPNISLVDHVGDLLDACPIRYLLKTL